MKSFKEFLNEGALKGDLAKVKDSILSWLEDQDVRLKKSDKEDGVFGDFFRIRIEGKYEYTYNSKEIKVFDVKADDFVETKKANSREAQGMLADLMKKYSKV